MCTYHCLETMIEKASFQHYLTLRNYHELSLKPELSDDDVNQLDQILEKGELDPMLSFLLGQLDYLIAKQLGLCDERHTATYRDQKAWLREHLELLQPEDIEYHRELQELLQRKGYYKGPVDGVAGKDFRNAVKAFQEKSHLKPDGIVGPVTLLKLSPDTNNLPKHTPNPEQVLYLAQLERCWENSN
jgi:murein L,D-transpeptidase YcbB/YkuD